MTGAPERFTAALAERYTIGRELGHGGMATVFLAHDLKHDRSVALKVLRPEIAHALGSERFLREIAVTARLDHPGILPLLDSGDADGFLYYTMPYVEGESLRDRLIREKQLPVNDALQIVREVGDALAHAHATGIIHRDIKPENILLSARHARVADFGIARALGGSHTLTGTGLAIGTLAYMSPEQAAGGEDVDARTDVYSLGCVLYEMLAGEPPFVAQTPQALLALKSLGTARPLRPIRPAVPEQIEQAVLTSIAPLPADRFATASDFVNRLSRTGSESLTAASARRRPRLRVLIAVGLTALVVLFGSLWGARSRNDPPAQEVLPTRIAVFPFVVEDPQLAYLREGLMDLVSSAIDGAGEIRRVNPYALMNRLRATGHDEAPELGAASRVARDLGAGRFLLGRVVPAGKSVQILASLYVGVDPTGAEHRFLHEGPIDSTSALIAAIARDVLLHVPTGAGTWATEESGLATSYAALREYSRGESLMRRLKQDSAAIAFRQALAVDSTFALAWLRLAFAEDYRLNDSSMVAAADRALYFAERLSTRDSMLAEVIHANYHGDGERARRAAAELVNAFPGYGEGWYQLGAAQFWYAWQRGRSPLDAEAAVKHALTVDAEHRQSLHLLSWIAEYKGNFARAESLQVQAWGHRWSLPPADTTAFAAFMEGGASWNTSRVTSLVYSTSGGTDRLHDASRIAQLLTDASRRPDETLSLGFLLIGLLEAAGGRWNAANSAFRDADAAGDGVGVLERGWLAALPFLQVEEEARRSLRDSLAGWHPPAAYLRRPRSREPGQFPFIGLLLTPRWLVPHAQNYVLGLLSAGLGDEAEAARYSALLHNAAEPSDSIGLLKDLSLEVQALAAMQQGDTSAGLAMLERASLRVASRYQVFESSFHTRPLTRLLRAEALAATGRNREALGWFAALPWLEPAFVLLAWTNLRQGEQSERLNEPLRAIYHYGRFVARWKHADSVHQPLVENITRRLEQLRAKSR